MTDLSREVSFHKFSFYANILLDLLIWSQISHLCHFILIQNDHDKISRILKICRTIISFLP